MRISIDVGGTFTDVILVDESTGQFHYAKTPTTHYDLAEGVLNGLEEILRITGASITDLRYLIHGTTIGTNAIVEGKGAKVGLESALRLLAKIQSNQDVKGEKIEGFTLIESTLDHVKIGCHVIAWPVINQVFTKVN